MTRPSPYIRRLWLGRQIRQLRTEHDITSQQLADALGFPRQQLSALENGRLGPDIDMVSGICDYLSVGHNRRTAIIDAAADGWSRGWWTADAERMGTRQATYADLESGTETIAEYAFTLLPGLLQTAAFADARLRSEPTLHDRRFDPAAAVAARIRRQQLLFAPGGPQYEAVLDEAAIRRCAAEPRIVVDQLRHIVSVCSAHPNITVRVLRADASIQAHGAPRSAYAIYRYRDPQRSVAVAADTLIEDVIHTEPAQTDPYLRLHSRLRIAAMGPEQSLHLLHTTAHRHDPIEGAAA